MTPSAKRPNLFSAWINVPWQITRPSKVDVSRTGHLDPDEPTGPTEVQDYMACARGTFDRLFSFLVSDPKDDTVSVFDEVVKDWNMMGQLMSWRVGGHEGLPLVAQPLNSALVLEAHNAVQQNAEDIRRKVAAPFYGLDLNMLGADAFRLGFIRKMKLAQDLFSGSLDRVDAWMSQSIVQRLRPIYDDAWPVVSKLNYLSVPLEPLRKLYAGAAEQAVATKDKIAHALDRHGKAGGPGGTGAGGGHTGTPAGGTPPGGTPPGTTGTGDPGAHGGGTPAPGTGTGHTTHGHTTHKKPTP